MFDDPGRRYGLLNVTKIGALYGIAFALMLFIFLEMLNGSSNKKSLIHKTGIHLLIATGVGIATVLLFMSIYKICPNFFPSDETLPLVFDGIPPSSSNNIQSEIPHERVSSRV